MPEKPKFPHVIKDEKTGKDTVLPGYYPNLDNEHYHGGPGFSSSNIKTVINKSPFHLWDQKLNPDQDETKEEPPKPGSTMNVLEFGNAYHCMVLEPTQFPKEFILAPTLPEGITSRMNAGKAVIREFSEKHAGKRVVCADDLDLLKNMACAVRNHPRASKVLEVGKGIIESSFFHVDEETGVLVKIRPDYMRRDKYMADLKSTIDANNDGFSKSVFNYGYHVSAAMYLEVFKKVTGKDFGGKFIFTAQEKARPYAIANYVISDEALALGAQQYRGALRQIAECIAKYGDEPWDSYPTDIQSIDLPGWAYQ